MRLTESVSSGGHCEKTFASVTTDFFLHCRLFLWLQSDTIHTCPIFVESLILSNSPQTIDRVSPRNTLEVVRNFFWSNRNHPRWPWQGLPSTIIIYAELCVRLLHQNQWLTNPTVISAMIVSPRLLASPLLLAQTGFAVRFATFQMWFLSPAMQPQITILVPLVRLPA